MPYAEQARVDASLLAPRLVKLRDARLGIVNNSWRCMNVITGELQATLTSEFGVAGFVERRISAAQVLPAADVDTLAAECDAVIVGIGN